ncbi:hypothetical protein N7495_002721 [Penicillium taxi]|uniref:uncharacterized protein n=1 Tax=Penicillium taxi TaxID=168475 RepID=UPI002544DE54|nr:uncharacterized protein N7495_002721 [Penicillium taxi]KAJ5902193.1 hypothetical protein N7495_002721 [Penicillium taxi]
MTIRHIHRPPMDSPSKQLFLELARDLERVRIFDEDLKKVKAYERKAYYDNLDRLDEENARAHTAALDAVVALHDQVRHQAEQVLEEHNRVEEAERQRKQEAARKEQERIEREEAKKLRLQQEKAARIEAERKAKEEAEKKKAEEAERVRLAAQQAKEQEAQEERERVEAEKRQQEEQAKKAQQEAQQKAQEQQQLAQKKQQLADEKLRAENQKEVGGTRLSNDEIRAQERYVQLHKDLKAMRANMDSLGKQNPDFKKFKGDLRRSITKFVGQLREGKGANKVQTAEIRSLLEKACKFSEPSLDIRPFIAFPPEEIANTENRVPALLIFGLNILAKCIINALLNEASINPLHAEPVGVLAAQIFSTDTFIYKGIPMSDILWAKYRVVCPALWGFTGSDKTAAGRRALGWWRETPDGPFVKEQTHVDRMTALGAGFSALTLRDFGKTTRQNPFPNHIFWVSLQKLLSIPTSELQETHIILLHSMLHHSSERVLSFFGQFGLAILRKAIVDLPREVEQKSMPLGQLKLLREVYLKEKNILL